ncbi:MAG: hypothetical protein AB7U24_00980 [Sulfurimonadaceae bacterium]
MQFQERPLTQESIRLSEPVPRIHSKKCRLLSLLLSVMLRYTLFAAPLGVWYFYDFFIALLSLVLLFILTGIARSKLIDGAVPLHQREYQYDDKAIADWYVAKVLCFEEETLR